MAKTDLAKRLKRARQSAGYESASEAARRIGANIVTYTAHENGGREYDRKQALFYASKFKVDPAWLMFGIQRDVSKFEPNEHIKEIDAYQAHEANADELIRQINRTADSRGIRAYWAMPDDFLTGRLRISAADALVVECEGDAMYNPAEPAAPGSLFPGERAIVDTGDRRPSPPGIFVIHDGTSVTIKILEIVHSAGPPAIRVSCRNPAYHSYELPAARAQIIGRVKGRIGPL